jgi:hypothetical protein
MQLYLQQSSFVNDWRVRTQNDARGAFVNVHMDSDAGGCYLSLGLEAARKLIADVGDGIEELQALLPRPAA